MLGFASQLISLVVVDASVTDADRVSWLALYNGIALGDPVEGGTAYDPRSRLRQQRDIISFVMGGA